LRSSSTRAHRGGRERAASECGLRIVLKRGPSAGFFSGVPRADCNWYARPADARQGDGVARGGGEHRTPVTDGAAQHAGAKRQPRQVQDGSSFNAGAQARHRHGLAEALRRNALHDCRGRTFEVTGPTRHAAWPVRRMMTQTAARAKTHAVAGPVDRGVRPRRAVRRLGGATGECDWRERSSSMRACRQACEGALASAGSEFSCGLAQARGSPSAVRAAGCAWHTRPSDARRGGGVTRRGGMQRTPLTDCAAQHAGAKRQALQAEDGSSFKVGAQARHAHGRAEALRRVALHDCRGRTFELSRARRQTPTGRGRTMTTMAWSGQAVAAVARRL
jgi:hypothetical protein